MAKALARQPLSLNFPARSESVTEARHSIESYARSLGLTDVDNVALAVSEAVGKAVLHAYRARDPGTIDVRAELLVQCPLRVAVIVDGAGISLHPESPRL